MGSRAWDRGGSETRLYRLFSPTCSVNQHGKPWDWLSHCDCSLSEASPARLHEHVPNFWILSALFRLTSLFPPRLVFFQWNCPLPDMSR